MTSWKVRGARPCGGGLRGQPAARCPAPQACPRLALFLRRRSRAPILGCDLLLGLPADSPPAFWVTSLEASIVLERGRPAGYLWSCLVVVSGGDKEAAELVGGWETWAGCSHGSGRRRAGLPASAGLSDPPSATPVLSVAQFPPRDTSRKLEAPTWSSLEAEPHRRAGCSLGSRYQQRGGACTRRRGVGHTAAWQVGRGAGLQQDLPPPRGASLPEEQRQQQRPPTWSFSPPRPISALPHVSCSGAAWLSEKQRGSGLAPA